MQSALANRPTKNRLFSLSIELQVLIYGYVDWEEDIGTHRKKKDMFRSLRPDILQEHMRYYWACQHDIALRGIPTLKNAPFYFCDFCESSMRREKHKISEIIPGYAHFRHGMCCRAMCTHLEVIRSDAGYYSYGKFEPYRSGYKAYYDRIYKEYFEDPDNKFDKDEYDELCLAYPEKKID